MKLFVFPLGQVILHPGTSKPLNIFEPRYLRMVQDSMSEKIPIAVGFVDQTEGPYLVNEGEPISFLRTIVGYGHPEILEQRMDGTLMVVLTAAGKARLGPAIETSRPYLMCEAEVISERNELDGEQALQYLNLQKHLMRWIGDHVDDQRTREQFAQALHGPLEVVGSAVAFLIRDPDLQQMILEMDDLNAKINAVMGILATGQVN